MKLFLMIVGVFAAAMIFFASIGPLIFLALGAWLVYASATAFAKTDSTAKKIFWVIPGLIGVAIMVHALPGLFGVAALIILFLLVKNWRSNRRENQSSHYESVVSEPGDFGYGDFRNFENEWNDMMRKYD